MLEIADDCCPLDVWLSELLFDGWLNFSSRGLEIIMLFVPSNSTGSLFRATNGEGPAVQQGEGGVAAAEREREKHLYHERP